MGTEEYKKCSGLYNPVLPGRFLCTKCNKRECNKTCNLLSYGICLDCCKKIIIKIVQFVRKSKMLHILNFITITYIIIVIICLDVKDMVMKFQLN